MQGEKGSLLELQRYHRGHSVNRLSPERDARTRDHKAGTEATPTDDSDDAEHISNAAVTEDDLKALRALQLRLLATPGGSGGAMARQRSGARRHTLANLSR